MQNNVFRMSANNIQNILQKHRTKNCAKRPPNFRDHLLRHPSAAFDAAPSHQNMSGAEFQNIPRKRPTKNCAKWLFRVLDHVLYFTPTKSNPQHNAVILLKLKITHQSIKVRPQKWRKRTPKK